MLENRVSAFESEIAERAKTHRKLKSEVSTLRARVERLRAEQGKDSKGAQT